MKFPIRRIALSAGVSLLVMALGSACTLSGSSAAPVPPTLSASPTPIPSPTFAITLPTPTVAPTLDVFGTQTATAQGTFAPITGLSVTSAPGLAGTPGGLAVTPLSPLTGATPTPLPNTLIKTPTPALPPSGGGSTTASCPPTHTVQAGETLFRISLKYGLTVAALAQANGITNVDFLNIGQVLKVPCGATTTSGSGAAGSTPAPAPLGVLKPQGDDTVDAATGDILHKVKAGENLFRIALAYGLDYHDVAKYNGITNVDSLEIGQVIRIKTK